jgi:hypothetical protein
MARRRIEWISRPPDQPLLTGNEQGCSRQRQQPQSLRIGETLSNRMATTNRR